MLTFHPPLYAILDYRRDSVVESLVQRAEQYFEAGINILQVRAKSAPESELRDLIQKVLRRKTNAFQKVIVNDFPYLCRETDADGVHIGQDDGSLELARAIVGADKIIGFSTHSLEQVRAVPYHLVDYIGFGPVAHSLTKPGANPVTGLGALAAAVKEAGCPVVAIGGINLSLAEAVAKTGAAAVAGIRELEESSDVAQLISKYRAAFEGSSERGSL